MKNLIQSNIGMFSYKTEKQEYLFISVCIKKAIRLCDLGKGSKKKSGKSMVFCQTRGEGGEKNKLLF